MKAEVISFNEGTLEARPYKDSVMSTRAFRNYIIRESSKGKYIMLRGRRVYEDRWILNL